MSARICHVRQARKASALESVNLVIESLSGSKLHAWTGANAEAGAAEVQGAADWVVKQLESESDGGLQIDLVCLDVEGSLCTWVSSPSREPQVLGAVARSVGSDPESGSTSLSPISIFAQTPMESAVQAVGAHSDESTRMPVLVTSEAPARLFLDSLDARKVIVARVASLWQVMAAAWDPAAKREPAAQGVDDAPASAQIVVDPAGRVLWSWSIRGVLLAAGAIRSQPSSRGDAMTDELAPRIAAEWLAWSAQVGVSPQRVACIAVEGDQSAAGFGAALARVWPGASVDLTFSEDPIRLTLQRVAQVMEDRSDVLVSLESLTTRPGRQHRAMYVWAAVALIAVAAAIGGAAVWLGRDASQARRSVEDLRTQWQDLVRKTLPSAANSPYGEAEALRTEVDKKERDLRPPDRGEATFPVMEELEILSMVLSTSDLKLEEVNIDTQRNVMLTVSASGAEEYEPLTAALRAIENPYVTNWDVSPAKQSDNRYNVRYSAPWSEAAKNVRPATVGGGK